MQGENNMLLMISDAIELHEYLVVYGVCMFIMTLDWWLMKFFQANKNNEAFSMENEKEAVVLEVEVEVCSTQGFS